MGDMDGGGGGAASSWDSGDASGGLAGSRAVMGGGSLPPRKRLLAGLKQNGWLSTSPPSSVVSPTASSHVAHVSGSQAVGTGEGSVILPGKHEEGCMGCNVVDANGMRRVKRGGVSLHLCSSCALLFTKSMFCPHCLAMYHDASLLGDPSMWLVCSRCRRSVHPDCEHKHSGSIPDASTYVCIDCVNTARRHREANGGVTGMRSKPSSAGRLLGLNCNTEAGSCASAAATAECSSPTLKKPRMMRERSNKPSGDLDHADASKLERHNRVGPEAAGVNRDSKSGTLPPSRKVPSQPHLVSVSSHEVAAAAKNAAAVAAKTAAAAKVNAAAKASAAVKAAAAAKQALEAAALAARAEAAARAELRRKTGNAEPRLPGPPKLEILVHSESRRERTFAKGEIKAEREEGHPGRGAGGGSVDDEELARQLHRVINSSPRISRSLTPLRRKSSVKTDTPSSGVSNSSHEGGRPWPRTGGPSPSEATHHQFKQQQTRPRSVTHKEFRRIDSRVSRLEVTKAEDGNLNQQVDVFEHSGHEAGYNHSDAHISHDIASGNKPESMEGVLFPHAAVQDEATILFDALVEADGEGMHAAPGSAGSLDRRPDYLQEILEAAVLTDTAMSFQEGANEEHSELETVRSEAEVSGQQHQVTGSSDVLLEENEGGLKNMYGDVSETMVARPSTLGLNVENPSNVSQDVEMQEAGAGQAVSVAFEEGTVGPSGLTKVRVDDTSEDQAKVQRITVDVDVGSEGKALISEAVSAPGSESKPEAESLSQAAVGQEEKGSTWQESKQKTSPGSTQAFATGVSFSSAAQIPIRTPAFASGPAGRHA